MDRKLPNELRELKIRDYKDLPKAFDLAMQNIGKYQPITLIEPGTETVLDSFFVRCYQDKTGKYLQLQEFTNEAVLRAYIDEFGDKAEILDEFLGFRLKF